MEELIDKELEEAQEHRHKCEIEERNALKVYLKAQRSLLQANARCTDLYHKRELYATKLRSLILNNSSLSWTSGQHQHLEMGQDYLPRHGYEIPTSSSQRQAGYNDINNPSFDSNNQGINNGNSNTFYHHMNGTNLGSEPCVEPDASTSEPLPQRGNTADGGYSPSDELGMSGNENEEMSPGGPVSTHLDVEKLRNKDSKIKRMDIDTASNGKGSTDSPQDPLQLEATLRSELFARLGTRAMKSRNPCNNTEPCVERRAENEVGSEKSQEPHCVVPLSRAEDNYLKGIEGQERSNCLDSKEMQTQHNIGANLLNHNYSAVSGDQDDMPHQDHYSTNTINISPLVFRSAYSQLREMSPFNSNQFLSKNNFIHANDGENENATCIASDERKWNNMLATPMPVNVGNLLSEESSYSCSPAVDPFWPLCMFELRGKCNNDECPWQHVKDYGDGNICQRQQTNSNNPDCEGRLEMHQQNCNGVVKVPKCHTTTILPTYLVGLDTLKGDRFGYEPVVALGNTQGWQKCFSITLATSNLLRNGLPNDGPLLDVGAERIEVHGAWRKQLSSFQWRSAARNQIKQAIGDGEQAVEMALLILNQEINTLQGVRKALFVLSKALESDPTSVVLWVVYLLICYANLKPNEKDDIFFFAVKNCEESYVLWLMYINSRKRIDDRLAAYDAALLVLCQRASAAPKDRMHESACILDLLLQMIDCLCMSGNVDKAIERSYGVFASKTKSDEPHHLPLSDILNCLTISDKCVFWICCVYLVIYRKLPDAVLHKFEHEKDLLDIEWPFVSLSEDEKEMAFKLVETAVESVDSYVYNESVKSEVNLRSAQLFALNHIRSMVALGRLGCLRNLLDKYVKLYPSCIELVLVSARIKKQEIGVDSFLGFEEAINMWPKEVPGIQCIWNQYIENAIQNQKVDFAKEITARWFHTVWQMQDLPNRGMDCTNGNNSCGSLGLNSKSLPDTSSSDLNQIDAMFGFLNLSLYRIFQNDETEASIAVDKARNAAMFGGLEQCLTKHISFLICDSMSLKEDGTNGAIKKVLEVYMDISSQASLSPKVLTRKFLQNIKKPRVQNLISNIVCPVSFDCSLLNLILQSRYGSSLLPQTGSDPKHLVDFVEAIMKVAPYNFQLAINVCKLLSKGYNSSDLHSAGLWFWACSTLANAILDAIPIPPEYVWVEAGEFLHNGMGIEAISEKFYKRALLVYPFSIMLWKCFYKLHKTIGDGKDVIEAAKERGIDLVPDTVSGS
ncbi:putative transcription factor C3H family [Lupinus albus]|uniref:Putative transcription factor C3H family n=1 Tax=Lupinus albus TaxID=3870 RepID=A0A6A4PU12_LUPAL|nr:putative transcription factor C3H family [Lupinus albus]